MISILIPVFNRDVNVLVATLSKQIELLPSKAEVILIDDGSEPIFKKLNSKTTGTSHVKYIEAGVNNGRIRIRQMLADAASYEWLLFLDCDSTIISDQFLNNYMEHTSSATCVISGGRVYALNTPTDCKLVLHWKYGSTREQVTFEAQGSANRFMTNNFLIRKDLFNKCNFNAEWKGYGYEDTWMGIQLEVMNTAVDFIYNPVKHDGLEPAPVFLAKSENALKNLERLSSFVTPEILRKHVKLYHYFLTIRSWKLLWTVSFTCFIFRKAIRKNLYSCRPSLLLFDLYRLNHFIVISTSLRSVAVPD